MLAVVLSKGDGTGGLPLLYLLLSFVGSCCTEADAPYPTGFQPSVYSVPGCTTILPMRTEVRLSRMTISVVSDLSVRTDRESAP